MIRTLGAALAAALTLTGLAASTGAAQSPATVLTTPAPTPTLVCPPALPVSGQVTGTTATSLTVSYSMLLTPPCGYDPPMVVTLFTSREDATGWRNPAAEAVSGPERYGTVVINGLTPDTDYWFRFSDAHGTRDPYIIGGPARTLPTSTCTATVTIDSRWYGGFIATVTVRNTGTEPMRGWLVSWRWSGDERVQSIWGGVAESAGQNVTVRNASWNETLTPGVSTTFGLMVAVSGWSSGFTPVCGR
ncbi:cellulose binding domain-containing protein [Micromonospora sp. RP3T]|uniref:cellulose binding domain-containing protein n=1 Tax=Micromonospora sp. RP3T TaxID=2135446 RepID=UPI003D73605D